MVTPFDEDGGIDLPETAKLARYLVEHGSHGLVVAGSTGEGSTLDDDEKLELLQVVLEEVGSTTTVILNTGSNDTRHSVELTKMAASAGADAGLVVAPYYNNPNAKGIYRHFEAVAEGSPDFPLIAYNIPSRSVINIDPEILVELGKFDNIVALKQANDDELQLIPGLDVLAGNDGTFLEALEMGGAGGILVAPHLVGDRVREIWDLAKAGDFDAATTIDNELRPAYEAMSVTVNPIPVKTALEAAGVCSATMRLPMVPASEAQKAETLRLLAESGVNL
jgi:4-hydroxy-tetrahydrodipicolinate synthase